MNQADLVERFCGLGLTPTGRPGGADKPLLVLAAVARCVAGKPRLAPFTELEAVVGPLLREFQGRRRLNAAATFWHLQDDGIWEVEAPPERIVAWQKKRPSRQSLIAANATGGFPEPIDHLLRDDSQLAVRVASALLDRRFSSADRDTVAAAVGLHRTPVRPEVVDSDILIKFAPRALEDVIRVLQDDEAAIACAAAVTRMKALNTGPWRLILGAGLTQELLWALLKPFGITPELVDVPAVGRLPQSGYTRTKLAEGSHVSVASWVATIGHRPTVPAKARRIRDLPLRTTDGQWRQYFTSKGWIPCVLCDASGCYWDGQAMHEEGSPDCVPISFEAKGRHELLNMCLSGHFGEWMTDVLVDEHRWRHIYEHLVEFPSDAMILRDSLRRPGSVVLSPDSEEHLPGLFDSIDESAPSRLRLPRPRTFDPTRVVESFVTGDKRRPPEETLALQEQASRGHRQILVKLHEYLVKSGWRTIEEICGAIDLWAVSPSNTRVIFEAKTIGETNEMEQCRSALAQLLEYRYVFGLPQDELCLVVDAPVSDARKRLLESLGVWIVFAHDGQLRGLGDRGDRLLGLRSPQKDS